MIFAAIPYLISFLCGLALVRLILKEYSSSLFLSGVLAAGTGLGISSHLTFLSFLVFNQLNRPFVIIIHIVVLAVLVLLDFINRKKQKIPVIDINQQRVLSLWPLGLFLFLSIPLWYQSNFYAHGGWDAWSTWNLKARFLYYGGEHWRDMFNPILWRSSPHYPLFLPLINVWGWCFQKSAALLIPTLTSFIFSLLSVGLLFTGLKRLTRSYYSLIPTIFLLTLPLFHKLSYSQYSDNVLGFYLLAGLVCLIFSGTEKNKGFAFLGGLFLGFLSFAKNEGLIAAVLIGGWALIYFLFFTEKNMRWILCKHLCIGAIIGGLPTLIFTLFYAPDNITFINALSSPNATLLPRVKMIFSFYLVEMTAPIWNLLVHTHILKFDILADPKWRGWWIALVIILILNWKRAFDKRTIIVPLFLASYMAIVTFYYFLNVYFEIGWWLQVTLHRILFAILPATLFWGFGSLWLDKEGDNS
ncbi:MAG: hypothetical protein KC684_01765 [Candidatus Omnitrophica bacterium]|nr:hypothetical protein [Candidatus Omnitrophota bacterium]